MKKWIIITITAVLSIILFMALIITVSTGGFKKSILTGRIYCPQNVYEEIWNLVLAEQHTRNQTVLTSATKDAYEDFDLGIHFVGIHIPECNVTISWHRTEGVKELSFQFPLDRGKYTQFIYNYETKTLFGNTDFSYLMDNFLMDYFEWCEDATEFSSSYSADELGVYIFQYANPIYNRELSN